MRILSEALGLKGSYPSFSRKENVGIILYSLYLILYDAFIILNNYLFF